MDDNKINMDVLSLDSLTHDDLWWQEKQKAQGANHTAWILASWCLVEDFWNKFGLDHLQSLWFCVGWSTPAVVWFFFPWHYWSVTTTCFTLTSTLPGLNYSPWSSSSSLQPQQHLHDNVGLSWLEMPWQCTSTCTCKLLLLLPSWVILCTMIQARKGWLEWNRKEST